MDRRRLQDLYRKVRTATDALCEPLEPEDMAVQTMPDASPTKWHLAHTSWFFETFVLRTAQPGHEPLDARYGRLFNSYYQAVGSPFPRAQRGNLSRPTAAEVVTYRRHVDRAMEALFASCADDVFQAHAFVIEVGLHHEEQHQELILTDVKTVLADNPLEPAYRPLAWGHDGGGSHEATGVPLAWVAFEGGVVEVGHEGGAFAFDNERPLHRVLLGAFELANRLVTCGEYARFIDDGGYDRHDLWLSDGWDERARQGWTAPMYWRGSRGERRVVTLDGARALDAAEPVCHVSFYEADAYARWAGARLPREEEWEVAASSVEPTGNFAERGALHPRALVEAPGEGETAQLFGDAWEWTASPYVSYPGYAPFSGALGEYNGKFMCNQLVLRGGSAFTPERHIRPTYRNFFPPGARWQMSGIRLAR